MQTDPNETDFLVTVVSWADGWPVTNNSVRVEFLSSQLPVDCDLVLLHSQKRLGKGIKPTSFFPRLACFDQQFSPGNAQGREEKVAILGYNGSPGASKVIRQYPQIPRDKLQEAIEKLYPEYLTYAEGEIASGTDSSTIYHKVSTLPGSSGAPIVDLQGRILGMAPSKQQVTGRPPCPGNFYWKNR